MSAPCVTLVPASPAGRREPGLATRAEAACSKPVPLQALSEAGRRQTALLDLLTQAGVAVKDLQAYGSQVVVTLRSEAAAKKCALVLGKAFCIRGILRTMDDAAKNWNTVLSPSKVIIWRVYACAPVALPTT